MSTLLSTLGQQAHALAPAERAQLAEVLLESLHDSPLGELEAEWGREIERRVAEVESGSAQLIPIAEVLALISRNPAWIRVNMPASLGKTFTPGS